VSARHRKARSSAWFLATVSIIMAAAGTAAALFGFPALTAGTPAPAATVTTTGGTGGLLHPLAPASYAAPARTYPHGRKHYPAPAPPLAAPAAATIHAARHPAPRATRRRHHHPRRLASPLPPPVGQSPPLEGVVTSDVAGWNQATGTRAELVTSFVSMARPLAGSFVHSAIRVAEGAEPVIELTPTAPGQPADTLAQIAGGAADGWLRGLRAQLTAAARPVVLSFAPEANGTWYAWSGDPGGFGAAWRHVRAVIGTAGVTWMWQVSAHNIGDPATADIGAYWPGAGQVDWVGLDGYYYKPGDTFSLRFAHTITEVRTWWRGPLLIAETAVSPQVGCPSPGPLPCAAPGGAAMAAAVANLFAGIRAAGLLGMVYFDLSVCNGQCSLYKQDFELQRYPAAVAAYVKAVHQPW